MRHFANSDPFAITGGSSPTNKYVVRRGGKRRGFSIDIFDGRGGKKSKKIAQSLVNANLLTVWLVFLLVIVGVLAARTAYLQVAQGQHFSAVAEGNRIRILNTKAPRGVIYDRHQNLLVENVARTTLAVVPVDLPNDDEELRIIAEKISEIGATSTPAVLRLLEEQSPYSYQPVTVVGELTHEQAIATEILSGKYPGVILKTESIRNYLTSTSTPSLAHVIGYTGKLEPDRLEQYLEDGYLFDDIVGKTGIESFYEKELKGVNGRQQVEVDAIGQTKEILASESAVSGRNLVLTIDHELQKKAEESLQRIMDQYGKKRGSVIIMDPNSGEILSMVSLPTFDNNIFSQGISSEVFSELINDPDRPLFSRSISGEYPSGSTFKLIVGAAALQEGVITPRTGVNSVGGIAVSRWFFPDWKAGGHGWTTLGKAIAESVNTFFYMIGGGYNDFPGLGVDRLTKYAKQFGLSQQLGIDLPNEASGFLPSQEWKEEVKGERWYIGDTYNLSIGQGDVLVTPLQVASWTAVFANGGTLYQPYVVKDILDADNRVVDTVEPTVLNDNFISSENIAAVKRGLREAVEYGSAIRLQNLPITSGGKTGTAQWSSNKDPHGWFTAIAPYENPQIVITVLVEEGEGGNTTALPVAYDILAWWTENR